MSWQIVLNSILAFIWMLLSQGYSFADFLVGYILGIFLLYGLRRFLEIKFYFFNVIAITKFFFLFAKEMIITNIDVARIVLSPRINVTPGIIAFPTKLKTDRQVALLAALISLTPGTLSMGISDDSKTIYVHSIHIDNKYVVINHLKTTFEDIIMEVMN